MQDAKEQVAQVIGARFIGLFTDEAILHVMDLPEKEWHEIDEWCAQHDSKSDEFIRKGIATKAKLLYEANLPTQAMQLAGDVDFASATAPDATNNQYEERIRPGQEGFRTLVKGTRFHPEGKATRDPRDIMKGLVSQSRQETLTALKASAAGHSPVNDKGRDQSDPGDVPEAVHSPALERPLQPPVSSGDSSPPSEETVDLMTPAGQLGGAPFAMAGPPIDHRGAAAC